MCVCVCVCVPIYVSSFVLNPLGLSYFLCFICYIFVFVLIWGERDGGEVRGDNVDGGGGVEGGERKVGMKSLRYN